MASTQFEAFLAEEVRKSKGISYPVKAGFLRRVFIKKASSSKLHPNPDDEFCFPEIGPNYEIMSRYEAEYRKAGSNRNVTQFRDNPIHEPIEVEKIFPNGYMILNGHHRWGGAIQAGVKTLPIRIVDLTQKKDIQEMLRNAVSTRRVALDLDETVFFPEGDPSPEKPLRFPLNRFYKERLRLGIPALFHMLNDSGYDIWIYTARYYSVNYLKYYLKHYRVHVTGIVTGTARKGPASSDTRKAMESMLESRYESTVHIDKNGIIRTFPGSRSFEEFPLSGAPETWSREVMDVFEKMKKNG